MTCLTTTSKGIYSSHYYFCEGNSSSLCDLAWYKNKAHVQTYLAHQNRKGGEGQKLSIFLSSLGETMHRVHGIHIIFRIRINIEIILFLITLTRAHVPLLANLSESC
jgi:hypothetical protein